MSTEVMNHGQQEFAKWTALPTSLPHVLSDSQYEEIEALFAGGYSRADVIKHFNWTKTSYYIRLKRDARLQKHERIGGDQWLVNMRNDLASAISKSATGHTVELKETFYDDAGNVKGLRVIEKYIPPQAATVNKLIGNILPDLVKHESEEEFDATVRALDDEDIETLFEIGKKLLK